MGSKKRLHFIRTALILILIVCLIFLGREYGLSIGHKKYLKDLKDIKDEAKNGIVQEQAEVEDIWEQDGTRGRQESSDSMPEGLPWSPQAVMDKFIGLYMMNNDMVGWLSIPGTVIDYPVMQCEDNDYYLHHNFYGEEDKYGCLFVKDIADIETPGTNFIIYGHNMKDGTMFGDLDKYLEKSFYVKHSRILFDTLYEEREYEILAVFLSHVYKSDEEGFRYYQFYQADTEEEFLDFYENIMGMSLYETGITAEYGDTFLMLSTCAYHEEDGRLVVVAKRTVKSP